MKMEYIEDDPILNAKWIWFAIQNHDLRGERLISVAYTNVNHIGWFDGLRFVLFFLADTQNAATATATPLPAIHF